MKAILFNSYGDPSVLELRDVPEPSPGPNEVLIRSIATSVNPFDIKVRTGKMKDVIPVTFPYIPGTDISGLVQSVGEEVTRISPGDLVFATTSHGSYAEMVCADEATTTIIPGILTINEAAAMAVPLTAAYSVLIEAGNLQPGERVLIHGAAGGVGHVVLQMAKVLGAYVIATASGTGVDFVRSLGADEVIDYKTKDFTKLAKNLDMVVDLVGGDTQLKSYPLVKKGGKLLSIVTPTSDELAAKHGITAKFVIAKGDYKKLDYGKKLVEARKIRIVVAKTLDMEDAASAEIMLTAGGVHGKIVMNF